MASKNEKAAQARLLAQQQVHKKERKSTMIIIAASVVGLALFAGLVYFIVSSSKVPGLDESGAVLPAGSDASGGIPVGTTGVVAVDVPEDATRVDIYEDFMCPICGQFEETNAADLDALREAGDISVYYHPISILDSYSLGTNYSTRAANAAATVADQAPEYFHAFSELLYTNQPEEGTEGLSDDEIAVIAVSVGVPQDVADSLSGGDFNKWVLAATDQSSKDGVGGTPTVMVNGEILEQTEVSYFNPGTLRAYLESL
ncbi:DsbA family protein [Demequina aurantiaca]|uniref:DsbA family protein n=1 Tax=Demequina aurantiaca TaxID=676200 RepID=UPI003D3461B8